MPQFDEKPLYLSFKLNYIGEHVFEERSEIGYLLLLI